MGTGYRVRVLLIVACVFLVQHQSPAPAQETAVRLDQHITASIGDAGALNPILHADTASGRICGMVFEGLIDRDRDLSWRGRLARKWSVTEEAYFVVNPNARRTAQQMAELIRAERKKRKDEDNPLGRCLANITATKVEPGETKVHWVKERLGDRRRDVVVTVRRPTRIKLVLKAVDPDVFTTLRAILGRDYAPASLDAAKCVDVSPKQSAKRRTKYAAELLRFDAAKEHNPVIVFHLRKGVKFHDGHEFDSGDVKFTYESIVDRRNQSPRIPDYEPVKSVETLGKYSVRVVYKRLFSPGFGSWAMGILPEHLLNEKRMRAEARAKGIPFEAFDMWRSAFNLHPVGCGPFKFAEWKRGNHIRLVRFDDYWEGPPEFKEYIVRVMPGIGQQRKAFLAGVTDTYACPAKEAEALQQDKRFQVFSSQSYGYTYIGYNMRRELFKDKRVRRALGMAIDVDAIIKKIAHGQGTRTTGPFVQQTDFYDKSLKPLPYNPGRALRLLKQAGWRRNQDGWLEKEGERFEFTLATNAGNDMRRGVAEAATAAWKKIGVHAKIEVVDWRTFISRYINRGNFDACVLGWAMGIDPDLYQIWHSSQTDPNELNFCGFKSKEADELILRIQGKYDHNEQVRLCHRLHRLIADEQPYTFLYVGRWTVLLDKRIVVVRRDKQGKITGYEKIRQAKSGRYGFDFNRWTKLPELPEPLR